MSRYSAFQARPADEMEWEDLLVRYEIAPRALGTALDDGDPAGPAHERVGDLLRGLVMNELWTAALFEAMRGGTPLVAGGPPRMELLPDDARATAERFARLRARNFAAVQRRGLEVWGWRCDAPGQGTVTAHQLIRAAVSLDGETLAGVRDALRGAVAC